MKDEKKEGSFAPCSAVYPKKRPKSVADPDRFAQTMDSALNKNKKRGDNFRDDIGIKMYRTGIELNKEKEETLRRKTLTKEKGELIGATFTPKITRSASMVQQGFPFTYDTRELPEVSLMRRYEEQKEKMSRAKSTKELQISQECPFKPLIDKKSNALAEKGRTSQR
jgi:hypothetical protein